jgi:hypothetical protein
MVCDNAASCCFTCAPDSPVHLAPAVPCSWVIQYAGCVLVQVLRCTALLCAGCVLVQVLRCIVYVDAVAFGVQCVVWALGMVWSGTLLGLSASADVLHVYLVCCT